MLFIIFLSLFISVKGVALGIWMLRCKENQQTIKLPIKVTSQDGSAEKMIKLLVRSMLSTEPGNRTTASEVVEMLQGE